MQDRKSRSFSEALEIALAPSNLWHFAVFVDEAKVIEVSDSDPKWRPKSAIKWELGYEQFKGLEEMWSAPSLMVIDVLDNFVIKNGNFSENTSDWAVDTENLDDPELKKTDES